MRGIRHSLSGILFIASFLLHSVYGQEAGDLQSQLDAALATIARLENRLSADQQALNDLKVRFVQEIAAREATINELEAQIAPSSAQDNTELQDQLSRSQRRNAELAVMVADLEQQLSAATTTAQAESATAQQALQDQLARSQQRNAELAVRVADLEAQLGTANASLTRLTEREQALQTAQEQLERSQRRNVELAVRIADLEVQLAAANRNAEAAAALQGQLASLQQSHSLLSNRMAADQQALNNLKVKLVQEVSARETRIQELEASAAEMTGLSGQLEQCTIELEANKVGLANLTSGSQTAAAQLQQRLAAEQKALSELRVKYVQGIAAAQTGQESALAQAATQNRAQITALNNLISSLSSQNAQLRADARATQTRLTQAQTATQTLQTRLATEQKALSELRVKYVQDVAAAQSAATPAQNQGQLNALNALISSLSNQNAQLRSAARAATPTATVAPAGQLTALNALIKSLSSQNEQIRTQLRQLQDVASSQGAATNATSSAAGTYSVQAGDSLSSIAEAFYGDANRWVSIARANNIPIDEANILEVGQVLVIP